MIKAVKNAKEQQTKKNTLGKWTPVTLAVKELRHYTTFPFTYGCTHTFVTTHSAPMPVHFRFTNGSKEGTTNPVPEQSNYEHLYREKDI